MTPDNHERDQVGEHNPQGKTEVDSSRAESKQSDELWQRSPERRELRRVGYVCLGVVLIPSLIVLGVLLYRQTAYSGAVSAATSIADQARISLAGKQNVEDMSREALSNDLSNLQEAQDAGVISTDAEQTAVQSDQNDVKTAVAATKLAEDKFDAAERTVANVKKSYNLVGVWLAYSIFVVALILATALVYQYFKSEKRRAFNSRRILDELRDKEATDEDPLDFMVLWKNNRDQLTEYHKLVLNYASSTRQTTILTLLAGFSFLLIVGVIALFAHSVPSSVAASVVAAAGATVTGFIGNAVLHNADTSSREVLAFFAHPLDVERVLAAERLVREMPESSQEAAKLLVVQALTRTSATDNSPNAERLTDEE
jgi:hypothetical protein